MKFREIDLPPFKDILVLAKNCPHGKLSVERAMELLLPNGFARVDVDHEKIESVLISKRLLAKVPEEELIGMLETNVFPYVSDGETLKVDLKVVVKKVIG